MPTGSTGWDRSRFVMGPLLGAGTFGEVYLARMTSPHGIEQQVAVKLLNADVDPRSQPVSRMRDEGRLLGGLNHPAILQVMDLCVLEARIGLVTEYVAGADLDDCVHGEQPIPPRAAVQVIGQVADALHAAFESRTVDGRRLGLVHRDVKPANIRVTPHGTVKLLDFGIAKSEDDFRETSTQQRMAFGTPAYMAPEILSYEVLEALPSRDVFALGCTLYEALVRERFFQGLDHREIGRLAAREGRFAEWRTRRLAEVTHHEPAVVDLLGRMLAYDHTARPSAGEVAETCLAVAEHLDGQSLWSWARQRTWPPARRSDGTWTGRTLFDLPLDESGRSVALVAPDGVASVLAEGGSTVQMSRALVMPSPGTEVRLPPLEREEPRPTFGIWLPLAGFLGMGTALALATMVFAYPQLLDGLLGRQDAGTGGDGGLRPVGVAADADDTGGDPTPTQPSIGAGGAAWVWGADPDDGVDEVGTLLLRTDHDVAIFREGQRPQRLPVHGYVRASPGYVEVRARFGGERSYAWMAGFRLDEGEQVELTCEPIQRRCDRD
ncbi:MAG: serine/threonine protein kinase [Alphaproteobacteria bacterium]|nr:serine/threonine protein kinase [Alphaproteobacteria bacterium]